MAASLHLAGSRERRVHAAASGGLRGRAPAIGLRGRAAVSGLRGRATAIGWRGAGCPWLKCSTALGSWGLPNAGRMLVGRWASGRLEVVSSVGRNDEGRENTPHARGRVELGDTPRRGAPFPLLYQTTRSAGRTHVRKRSLGAPGMDGHSHMGSHGKTHADPRRCEGRSRTPSALTDACQLKTTMSR